MDACPSRRPSRDGGSRFIAFHGQAAQSESLHTIDFESIFMSWEMGTVVPTAVRLISIALVLVTG